MRIPQNIYGAPARPKHLKMVHEHLISKNCPVCKTKAGYNCKTIVYDNVITKKRQENVHMGRLPSGFNSITWLKENL